MSNTTITLNMKDYFFTQKYFYKINCPNQVTDSSTQNLYTAQVYDVVSNTYT